MSTTDHVSETRTRLETAIADLADSDTFRAWLRARAAFHDYSFGNVCLIVSQRPDASQVAGYKAWQGLGRQVRKGERGIKILAPCVRKVEDKESGEEVRRVVAFRAVSVFDIDQTEGEALPPLDYRPLEGECPDLADFVCGVAMSAGLDIRRERLTDGTNGYLRRSENLIVVDSACSGAMAAKVVCHELGHFFDPWLTEHPEQYGEHRGDCEAVAESCAYILAARFGLDAGPSAVGYVASWIDGDVSRVKSLAERIDAAVREILATEGGER